MLKILVQLVHIVELPEFVITNEGAGFTVTAKLLAALVPQLLLAVTDIGPIVATHIKDFFIEPHNIEVIKQCLTLTHRLGLVILKNYPF